MLGEPSHSIRKRYHFANSTIAAFRRYRGQTVRGHGPVRMQTHTDIVPAVVVLGAPPHAVAVDRGWCFAGRPNPRLDTDRHLSAASMDFSSSSVVWSTPMWHPRSLQSCSLYSLIAYYRSNTVGMPPRVASLLAARFARKPYSPTEIISTTLYRCVQQKPSRICTHRYLLSTCVLIKKKKNNSFIYINFQAQN